MNINLEEINSLVQTIIGNALNYKIDIAIIITQIDEDEEHTPVNLKDLSANYADVFKGINEMISSNMIKKKYLLSMLR